MFVCCLSFTFSKVNCDGSAFSQLYITVVERLKLYKGGVKILGGVYLKRARGFAHAYPKRAPKLLVGRVQTLLMYQKPVSFSVT